MSLERPVARGHPPIHSGCSARCARRSRPPCAIHHHICRRGNWTGANAPTHHGSPAGKPAAASPGPRPPEYGSDAAAVPSSPARRCRPDARLGPVRGQSWQRTPRGCACIHWSGCRARRGKFPREDPCENLSGCSGWFRPLASRYWQRTGRHCPALPSRRRARKPRSSNQSPPARPTRFHESCFAWHVHRRSERGWRMERPFQIPSLFHQNRLSTLTCLAEARAETPGQRLLCLRRTFASPCSIRASASKSVAPGMFDTASTARA